MPGSLEFKSCIPTNCSGN